MKKVLLLSLCLVSIVPLVLAQTMLSGGTQHQQFNITGDSDCGAGDPLLPTDGSRVKDNVAAASSNYYFIRLKAGHSYAAEVWDAVDSNNTVSAHLYVWDSGCQNKQTVTDIVSMDPDLSSMYAARISWIQPADALEVLEMHSGATSARNYEIRIVDTTLYSPRWSTYSGFLTQWGFYNVTNTNLPAAVFTVFDTTGVSIKSVGVTAPAGKVKFYSSVAGDLNLPNNASGSVRFAYVGSPGAIQADAAIMTSSVSVIFPVKFEARNYQH